MEVKGGFQNTISHIFIGTKNVFVLVPVPFPDLLIIIAQSLDERIIKAEPRSEERR
jgi:hypothetical protein